MNLVYSVAIGEQFDAIVHSFVESIRGPGEYSGPMIIFSDHDIKGDFDLVRIPEYTDFLDIAMLRVRLGRQLPSRKHETVMYIDPDHLAFQPIQPLLDVSGFHCFSEGRPLGRSICHNGYLSQAERKAATGDCFNSGLFVGPGRDFVEALAIWETTYKDQYQGDSFYKDQASLNAAAFRESIKIHPYRPGMVVGANKVGLPYRSKETILVHYWGKPAKRLMLRTWRRHD